MLGGVVAARIRNMWPGEPKDIVRAAAVTVHAAMW